MVSLFTFVLLLPTFSALSSFRFVSFRFPAPGTHETEAEKNSLVQTGMGREQQVITNGKKRLNNTAALWGFPLTSTAFFFSWSVAGCRFLTKYIHGSVSNQQIRTILLHFSASLGHYPFIRGELALRTPFFLNTQNPEILGALEEIQQHDRSAGTAPRRPHRKERSGRGERRILSRC